MVKTKKSGDTLSSRLALVMKSGKGKQVFSIAQMSNSLTTSLSYHGYQVHHEDSPLWQGQARPHLRKLPSSAQVRA